MAAGLVAATAHAQSNAWKVPRTPDGHPDLQGVWSNNSVTPMTRPTQWKDKERLTDAEVRGAEAARRASTPIRAATRSSAASSRSRSTEGEGQVQPDLVRPHHRQLQPVLDGRSRLGQPDVAHHRSAERPDAAADARGAASARTSRPRPVVVEGSESGPRGRADGPEDRPLSERCISYGAPRTGTGYNSYVQIDSVAGDRRHPAGDDSRRAPRADERHAAPAEGRPSAARRSARPLGRRHAGRRDDQLHRRLPGLDARRAS